MAACSYDKNLSYNDSDTAVAKVSVSYTLISPIMSNRAK